LYASVMVCKPYSKYKGNHAMELTFSPSGHTVQLSEVIQTWAAHFASSMLDTMELLYLAGTISSYAWEPGSILVEIGAYTGQTTVFMAKVLQFLGKHVHILSIDPFERVQSDALNPQGIYLAYVQNIQTHNVEHICLPLAAFSQDAAPIVPNQIGVLMLDGGHRYPIVSQDLALYGEKILPGGFIFIDDYGPYYPDVMHAVDEYFVPERPYAILHKSYFIVAQRMTDNLEHMLGK